MEPYGQFRHCAADDRDFRCEGDQPNQIYGQTADMMAEIAPLVKELVQQELQKQYYDARIYDLEKRVRELEENYRDLAALVRGRQESGEKGSGTEVKHAQSERPAGDLHQRLNNVDETYKELRAQLAFQERQPQYGDFGNGLSDSPNTGHGGSAGDAQGPPRPRFSPPSSRPNDNGQGRGTLPFTPSPRVEGATPPLNSRSPGYSTPPRGVQQVEQRPSPELTKKHQKFMSNPDKKKPVAALPGIEEKTAARLEADGYDTAGRLLQKYRELGRDGNAFKQWLHEVTNYKVDSLNQERCYACIKEWDSL